MTEKIILFGSYAQGTASKYSDIDLVIISKDFAAMGFKQRCEVLGRAIAEIMEPIEPLAYTPEEFEQLSINSVVSFAVKANERREAMLDLREKLMFAEQQRLAGDPTVSLDEATKRRRRKSAAGASLLKDTKNKPITIKRYVVV